MTIDWKKSSVLLESRLPEFVRENYPLFVSFMAAYYEWLDSSGNVSYGISNFSTARDVDLSEMRFLDQFLHEFMSRIPKNIMGDQKLLLKHIKKFYSAKGTERATRFLFRVLFNSEIDFYYPSMDIWKLDASQWQIDKSLKVVPYQGINLGDYIYSDIVSLGSGAYTRIENVVSYVQNGIIINELSYNKSRGTFHVDDIIVNKGDGKRLAHVVDIITYPGKYVGYDSHLETTKKLRDDSYYQEFSYVIKSGIPFSEYSEIVSSLVQPTGTKLFSEFVEYLNLSGFSYNASTSLYKQYYYNYDCKSIYHSDVVIGGMSTSSSLTNTLLLDVTYKSEISTQTLKSDHFYISSSEDMTPYGNKPGTYFESWSGEDFMNGKGVFGTGNTTFKSYLIPNKTVLVKNNLTSAYYYNEIKAVDDNTTALLKFAYNGTLTDGSFYV